MASPGSILPTQDSYAKTSPFWRGPRWTLAMLLAILGMLGPFSVDTYIPPSRALPRPWAQPVEMQQTLSAYLLGFAFMNLFHGALGQLRTPPVILWGLVMFTIASAGCALSQNIPQLVIFRYAGACPRAPASWSRAPSCATSFRRPRPRA